MFGSSNQTRIQKQTLKTTQKWVTGHKTKLLLWPFQFPDLYPVENEWGELKRGSTVMELGIWRIWSDSGWRNGLWSLVRCSLTQWFPTTFLEAPQHCTFCISPLSDTPISGLGVSTNELMIWIRCVWLRRHGNVRHVRMLFIDFSSAFNTIFPQQLINKLNLLGLNNSLCNWILDFLTGRPQSVRVGHNTSSTTTLSTGAPQGCVLSPLLFTLLIHDCTAKFSSNHIIKFTTVVGLISNNDETHYREEVAQLAEWCGTNNLSLNVGKTKEVVLDFRRNSVDQPPLTIDSSTVERVSSTKFLGVHITEDLTWTTNTTSLSKKAQQCLHFLRRLKRASLPPPILTTFYRGTIWECADQLHHCLVREL